MLFVVDYCLLLIFQSVFSDSAVSAEHRSSKLTVIRPQPPAAAQLGSCRVVPMTGKSVPVSRHSECRVLAPKQVPAASRLRRWPISRGSRPRVAAWSPCQTACTVSSQVRRMPGCSDLVLVGTHCFRLEAVYVPVANTRSPWLFWWRQLLEREERSADGAVGHHESSGNLPDVSVCRNF